MPTQRGPNPNMPHPPRIGAVCAQVWSVLLGVVLVLAGGVSEARADPWSDACTAFRSLSGVKPPAAFSAPAMAALDDHFRRAEAVGFSGSTFVEQGGRLLLNRGYGYADWVADRAMAPDTVFDIGSVSKQFTAAAIMKLEEMGKLQVDDPITRFFPDVPADKRGVTLHHLLTHSSGFGLEVRDAVHAPSRAEMVALTLTAKLNTPPGQTYSYSNAGYSLLGAVIEIASGEGYEPFLRRHLWLPAGMRDTGWSMPEGLTARMAGGYANSAAVPHPDDWIAGGPRWSRRGPGGIRSTSDDLRRWVTTLRRGRVLSEGSVAKLITPHILEEAGRASYSGYGWAISGGPDGSCTIAHDGGTSLHYNVLRIYPERDLATHALTLNERGPLGRGVLRQTSGILLAGRKSSLPPGTAPSGALRSLAGWWRSEDGSELELIAVGSRLLAPTSGPNVVRLLTGFAPLNVEDDRRAERARSHLPAIMDALERGEYAPLFGVLAVADNREEEMRYWPGQWAQWKERHGPYRGTEVIATALRGERLFTYILVKFERFNVVAAAARDAQGGVSIGTDIGAEKAEEFIPSEYVLAPLGADRFHVYNPAIAGAVEVHVEERGDRLRIISPRGQTTLVRSQAAPGREPRSSDP